MASTHPRTSASPAQTFDLKVSECPVRRGPVTRPKNCRRQPWVGSDRSTEVGAVVRRTSSASMYRVMACRRRTSSIEVQRTEAGETTQRQVSASADIHQRIATDRCQSQAGTRLALASVSSWPPVPSTAGRRRSRQVDANMPDAVVRVLWAPVRTCWFSAGLKLQGR